MPEADYEYRGLLAETWDLFRGDTSAWADRALYLDLVREFGEPVLDVGCGTGRILVDFAAQGVDIDGVDNSPEMLALCREKATEAGMPSPALYAQEMEAMDLPRRYRTILVPSSSFQLVLDPDKAQEAMRRFHAHLLPGGALVMPFMVLWKPDWLRPLETEWEPTGERARPDGTVARRWSRSRLDPEAQLEHTRTRYEIVRDGEVIRAEEHERSPATRWYTPEQVVALYETAGFTDIVRYREFTREPASERDSLFTVVGRRPLEGGGGWGDTDSGPSLAHGGRDSVVAYDCR